MAPNEWFSEGKAPLRYEIPYVPISDLAAQEYCELKVAHEHEFGPMESPEKQLGTAIHKYLLEDQMTPISPEELRKQIESGEDVVCCPKVDAVIDGLHIVGRPDWVAFLHGRPVLLVELKTNTRAPKEPWRDHITQVQLYGLALEEMGYNCQDLKLAVTYLRRDHKLSDAERETYLEEISGRLNKGRTGVGEFLIGYSQAHAIQAVKKFRGFWLMERDPVPTRNRAKCTACVYSKQCTSSLA